MNPSPHFLPRGVPTDEKAPFRELEGTRKSFPPPARKSRCRTRGGTARRSCGPPSGCLRHVANRLCQSLRRSVLLIIPPCRVPAFLVMRHYKLLATSRRWASRRVGRSVEGSAGVPMACREQVGGHSSRLRTGLSASGCSRTFAKRTATCLLAYCSPPLQSYFDWPEVPSPHKIGAYARRRIR